MVELLLFGEYALGIELHRLVFGTAHGLLGCLHLGLAVGEQGPGISGFGLTARGNSRAAISDRRLGIVGHQ